jgi:DNA-binding transcriptional regulator PaaX
MKITLRKKDSVISAVLFVFNIYREYKNSGAIRLGDLLDMMRFFDKSEASVRTGLSRMVKSGILASRREAGETTYELTRDGLGSIDLWNRGLSRFFYRHALRQKDWDGAWRFLTITGFNKSDYDNQFIVDELRECGLREINNNIWATPYPVDKDVFALLDERKFRYLKIEGSMQPNSGLDNLLNDVFDLNALKRDYTDFLHKSGETADRIAALHGGALLPVLFETGWGFYDTATSDPALPKALLPEWGGDKAAERMKTMRPLLLQEITGYFKEKSV